MTAAWYTTICFPPLLVVVSEKRPRIEDHRLPLHQDNAPAHKAHDFLKTSVNREKIFAMSFELLALSFIIHQELNERETQNSAFCLRIGCFLKLTAILFFCFLLFLMTLIFLQMGMSTLFFRWNCHSSTVCGYVERKLGS